MKTIRLELCCALQEYEDDFEDDHDTTSRRLLEAVSSIAILVRAQLERVSESVRAWLGGGFRVVSAWLESVHDA